MGKRNGDETDGKKKRKKEELTKRQGEGRA